MPMGGFSYAVAAGPDGGLWFTEANTGRIGRAPACGLGFGVSFTGGTLTMNFNLGIDTPATVPPRAFTMTWSDVPNLGDVTIQAALTTGAGQAICSEWNGLNTGQ
jgi:hypothetical protein